MEFNSGFKGLNDNDVFYILFGATALSGSWPPHSRGF